VQQRQQQRVLWLVSASLARNSSEAAPISAVTSTSAAPVRSMWNWMPKGAGPAAEGGVGRRVGRGQRHQRQRAGEEGDDAGAS
jgi:hypothetical protein